MEWMIGYWAALGAAGVAAVAAVWQMTRVRRERKRREDEVFKLQTALLREMRKEQALQDQIGDLEREIRQRDNRIHHIMETRRGDLEAARREGRAEGLREANLQRIEEQWNAAQDRRNGKKVEIA